MREVNWHCQHVPCSMHVLYLRAILEIELAVLHIIEQNERVAVYQFVVVAEPWEEVRLMSCRYHGPSRLLESKGWRRAILVVLISV